MDPRPKPGRDDLGRFVSNDATAVQFGRAVHGALKALCDGDLGTALARTAEVRDLYPLLDAGARTAEVRDLYPLLDAGARPPAAAGDGP